MIVVGLRNWMFAGTVQGANASADLSSLLQACIANGVNGYDHNVVDTAMFAEAHHRRRRNGAPDGRKRTEAGGSHCTCRRSD